MTLGRDRERLLGFFVLCSLVLDTSALSINAMGDVNSVGRKGVGGRGCPCHFGDYPYKSILSVLFCLLVDLTSCAALPFLVSGGLPA